MAKKCIVCEGKIGFTEPYNRAMDHSMSQYSGPYLYYHTYCHDKFEKNPTHYIEIGRKAYRICPVCEQRVTRFSLDMIDGINIHDTCRQKFMKEPEKYGGKKYEALKKWKKSLPVITVPQRPSLSSLVVKKTGETIKEKAIQSVVMAKNAAKTSKSIFKEADKRVGKIEDIRTEEDAYEFAAKEVEKESYKKGLWAKAFSDAEGNEKKQAALYIKYRAEQLIQFLEDLQ